MGFYMTCHFRLPLTVLLCLGLAGAGHRASEPVLIAGQISFDERVWSRGSLPSLTFTVSAGRGTPTGKVAAFLYVAEAPGAFTSAVFPPQFAGIVTVPGSIQVVVDRVPERGPVNEHSRERFVQGAIFDLTSGALLGVTNEDYLDITYSAPPTVFSLDFETEDDFTTALVNGQDLSTPPEFGRLLSLSSAQPVTGAQHLGPAVFDTDPSGPNAASSDPDLLVGLGNALILQENAGQTTPGVFTLPDDAANGGSLVFDFTGFQFIEKVEPRRVDLIDMDKAGGGAKIFLTDVLGHSRVFSVPSGWTTDIDATGGAGFATLDLTTTAPQPGVSATATATSDPTFLAGEVVRMEVTFIGSGALDNLVFAREADPGLVRTTGPRAQKR